MVEQFTANPKEKQTFILTGENEQVFVDSSYNSAVAASGTESIASSRQNREKYGPFNWLLIKNRDAVDIKILLDGLNEAGKIFELAAGDTLIIEPADGITFSFLTQTNLDSAVAQTANNILFRWAKIERKRVPVSGVS